MISRFFAVPVIALFFSLSSLQGQSIIARGGIVAEVAVVADSGRIYVSYKGSDTVVVPKERTSGAFYNVTDLPLGVRGVTFGFGYFASQLLALSPEGEVLWRKKYGRSRSSRPSGIAGDQQGGIIAAMPAPGRPEALVVDRIDGGGTIHWRTHIDSLSDAPRVVTTGHPYLTVFGRDEKVRYFRNADSSISVGTAYDASTVQLTIDSGKGYRAAGRMVITSEKVLGAMVSAGFAIPVSSRQTDWLTWKGDSLVLYVRQAEGGGGFVLPLPDEADGLTIRKGIFRNGTYAAIGNPGESDNVLVTSARYGPEAGEEAFVRVLEGLKGMAIIDFSFNQSDGITVAAAIDNRVKIVDLNDELVPVNEMVYTIDVEEGGEVAVAAIEPAADGGYHLLWVTEGEGENLLWYEWVE